MGCHLAELQKAKFTKEHSEVSRLILERVDRRIDAVQSQTELGTLCCIPCLEELLDMIAYSS